MKVGMISNNDLCIPSLYFLTNSKIEVELYFANSPVHDSKRDSVTQLCTNFNIPVHTPNDPRDSLYEWVISKNFDIVFVLGYRHKINLDRIKNIRQGIYNIHFGKLPEFRGSSPVFWQMKKMEDYLGICIHNLTEQMDAGALVWEKHIKNERHYTYSYVQYLFSNIVVEGMDSILRNINTSIPFQQKEQDESKAFWYRRPTLDDVLVKWDRMKAGEICALINACNSWNVGAISLYNGMEVKLIDASYSKNDRPLNLTPGTITGISTNVAVSCINDEQLEIHYLSINGIPVAARFAQEYGITKGQCFTYPSD